MNSFFKNVIPAEAGIQDYLHIRQYKSIQRKTFFYFWIPAFAGMTDVMSLGPKLSYKKSLPHEAQKSLYFLIFFSLSL